MQIDHIDYNCVRVTQTSILTGNQSSMLLPLRQGQIEHWLNSGTNVQDAFPWLSANVREFLMTGITPDEWNATFPEGDE